MVFNYYILQLPTSNKYCFSNFKNNVLSGYDYVSVWNSTVEAESEHAALNEIFKIFNVGDRPDHYAGRSLSVSDIILISDRPEAYAGDYMYINDNGFVKIQFERYGDKLHD